MPGQTVLVPIGYKIDTLDSTKGLHLSTSE